MSKLVLRSLLEDSRVPWRAGNVDYTVTVKWGLIDGIAECVGVSIDPVDVSRAVPMTASLFREFRAAEIVRRARRERYQEIHGGLLELDPEELAEHGISRTMVENARREGVPFVQRSMGRPRDDDSGRYERVARIYSEARMVGEPPLQAVRREMVLSTSTASRYVKQARLRGLLPETTPGRVGPPATDEIVEQRP